MARARVLGTVLQNIFRSGDSDTAIINYILVICRESLFNSRRLDNVSLQDSNVNMKPWDSSTNNT